MIVFGVQESNCFDEFDMNEKGETMELSPVSFDETEIDMEEENAHIKELVRINTRIQEIEAAIKSASPEKDTYDRMIADSKKVEQQIFDEMQAKIDARAADSS
jgi:hypothetical protein